MQKKSHSLQTLFFPLLISIFLTGCATVEIPKATIHRIEKSEEVKELEWLSVVNDALQNNPDLKQARLIIKSRARSRDIAVGDYLPSVNGNASRIRSRQEPDPVRNSLSLNVTGEENLFSGFETTGNFLQAKKSLEAAEWNYKLTSAQVRFRLRSVYIDLLRLQKLLEVETDIADRRKQNAELIRLRYDAGREHLGSVLRAEAIAEQAAVDVRQTKRLTESQAIRLGREIGGRFELPLHVKADLENIIPAFHDQAPDYVHDAEEAPTVQRAKKDAETLKAAIISAQSVIWPKLDASAEYGKSGIKGSDLDKESLVALTASMPFFNGGKNISLIRKSKADYEAGREAYKSVRDDTIAQLADAWTVFINTTEDVSLRKQFLDAAEKRSEIIRSEYTTGLVNFQDFDIAEQDLSDSKKNYVESISTALSREASWELAKGSTLENAQHEKTPNV